MTAEEHYAAFLRALGVDLDADPELAQTPARVADLMRERFDPTRAVAELSPITSDGNGDVVIVRGLQFQSLCVHHATPFFGVCSVAYVPAKRIAGFGSIDRLVQSLARRPQLQERMTAQVADALMKQLEPAGVAVAVRARQMCMELTGTAPGAETITLAARGSLGDDAGRNFALGLLQP